MTSFATRFLLLLGLGGVLVGSRLGGQSYSFSTLAGGEGFSVDGTGAAATLSASQLAVDAVGNVYFPDPVRQTIRRISPEGVVTTIAGATSQPGSADGPVALARFRAPTGIALDALGNLYVGDTGNRVLRRISAGVVTTIAGQVGVEAQVDGTGAAARFVSLGSLAVDGAGNVFLCDERTGLVLVRKVTPAGVVSTLLEGGSFSSDQSLVGFYPSGLAADPAGNLFITDNYGCTIRKLTPSGTLTVVTGTPDLRGSADGPAGVAQLSSPRGIARAVNGDLFFVDHSSMTLRRMAPDGTVTTLAGQPDEPYRPAMANGVGGNARFNRAGRPAIDPTGNLYLTDGDGESIVRKGVPTSEPAPPIVTVSPAQEMGLSRNVGARSSITFKVVAIGGAPLAFQWLKNQASIPGATGGAFTLASTVQADEGEYSVRVSNAQGTYTSQAVKLWVYTPAFEAFTTRRSVPGGSFLWGIASGGGQLVAVGTGGGILTSVDGRGWTVRESGTREWLLGVTYGAGQYVVVGDHGTILISRDGGTWRRVLASGTLQRLNNVAYGNGRFVAVGEGGAIVTSPDAERWTPRVSGVASWLRGLVWEPPPGGGAFGAGFGHRFYASGQGGVMLSSETGESWSRPTGFPPTGLGGRDLEGLAGGPTGIGQEGVIVRLERGLMASKSSPPITSWATNWYARELGLQARFRGIASAADALFVTGENGVVAAAPNSAGPWSFIPTGTTANLVSGAFHGNALFVVGENETVLESQPLYPTRLVNLATRGLVGSGESVMIGGFVVSGSVPRTVLLRAAGPALGALGVPDFLTEPVLTLSDAAGRTMANNAGWSLNVNAAEIAAAARQVGAFAFAVGSADAAMLMTLSPGAYTAQVTGQGSATGVALVEAYDTEPAGREGSRFVNLSTRGRVGTDENRFIAGFVLSGAASRRVLIRAVGPALGGFGLAGVLAEPKIELYAQRFGRAELRQTAGAWSLRFDADEIRSAALLAGAFALPEDSLDAALVADLLPGAYTVQVSGVNNATGLAIVEVYDLP